MLKFRKKDKVKQDLEKAKEQKQNKSNNIKFKKSAIIVSSILLFNLLLIGFVLLGYTYNIIKLDILSNQTNQTNNITQKINSTQDALTKINTTTTTFANYINTLKTQSLISEDNFNKYIKITDNYINIFKTNTDEQQKNLDNIHQILLGDKDSIGSLVISSNNIDVSTKRKLINELENIYNSIISYNMSLFKYTTLTVSPQDIINEFNKFKADQLKTLGNIFNSLKVDTATFLPTLESYIDQINSSFIFLYNNLTNYFRLQKNVDAEVFLTLIKQAIVPSASTATTKNILNELNVVITFPFLNKTFNLTALNFIAYIKYSFYYLISIFSLSFLFVLNMVIAYRKQNKYIESIDFNSIEENNKKLEKYREEIKELSEIITQVESTNSELTEKYNQVETINSDLIEKYNQVKDNLEKQIENYKNEITELNKKIEELTTKEDITLEVENTIKQYKEQIDKYIKQIEILEKEKSDLALQHQKTIKELEDLKEELKDVEEDNVILNSKLNTLKEEYSDLLTQYDELSKENKELKNTNEELTSKFENLNLDIETNSKNIFALIDQYNKLKQHVDDIEDDIKAKLDLVNIIKSIKDKSFNELKTIVMKKIEYFTEYQQNLHINFTEKMESIQKRVEEHYKKSIVDAKQLLIKEKDKYSKLDLDLEDVYVNLLMLTKAHYNKLNTLFAETNLKSLVEKESVMEFNINDLFVTLNNYKTLINKLNNYKNEFQSDISLIKKEIDRSIQYMSEDYFNLKDIYNTLEKDIDLLLNEIIILFNDVKESILNVSLEINNSLEEIFDNLLNTDMLFDTIKTTLEKEKGDVVTALKSFKRIA